MLRSGPPFPVARVLLLLGVGLGLTLADAPARAQPADDGAHALLERIRTVYRDAPTLRDGGRLEITPSDGTTRQLAWSLASGPNGYRLSLRPEGPAGELEERVVWRDADGAVEVFDRGLGLRRTADSLPAEVAAAIGLGGLEALALPAHRAGSTEALADPEGAALEGLGRCGEAECRILYLARMSGDLETWMWVDDEALIHRLEVVRHRPGGAFLRIRVDHHPVLGEPVDASFTPPPETRLAAADEWPAPIDDAAIATFGEEITVQLLTASLRVVDSRGNPAPGLGPADFRVVVGGQEVPLAAVDWVPARGTPYAVDADLRAEEVLVPVEPAETQARPVVLFVQADFNSIRIKGHLKFLPFVEELLEGLGEGERVAVVSFDSHLKLWSDFTRDREATYEAVVEAVRFGNLPELRRSRGPGPFLADSLDFRAAKDAATPEQALTVVGRALDEIEGPKDLIFLGWGLGRWTSFGMRMDFDAPVGALKTGRTTVYVLDVTDADFHTLELGLQSVAARTGGTYARTNRFGAQAVRNLLRALSGHYVVTIDRSHLPDGESEMTIELREPNRGLRILGNPRFVG